MTASWVQALAMSQFLKLKLNPNVDEAEMIIPSLKSNWFTTDPCGF
jgi:hypothetical protein